MKAALPSGPAKLLVSIVLAALAATWAAGEARDQREMANREREEVARMTDKTKTVCVGRFLIDLPADAQVAWVGPRIDGLDIDAFPESPDDFRVRLAERQRQIESTPDRLGGMKNLESVRDFETVDGMVGKMFIHGRTVSEGFALNGLERVPYRYEGVAIEAMVHGKGVSVDLGADNYDPDLVDNLPHLVAQIVPNPEHRIPTAPGFCLRDIYLRDPLSAEHAESITLMAHLPSHPDVALRLILMAGLEPDAKTLLERSSALLSILTMFERQRIQRIRAEQRTISGLLGDELARRFVESDHIARYSFWWEVVGTRDDVMKPFLSLTLLTGEGNHGPVDSSLSEAVVTGLWDKVASSLRHRPVAPAPTPHADLGQPGLGSHAVAGEPCPASGWWQCSEAARQARVLGGGTRYFTRAERMPQALLLLPPTLWQRVRGLQPSVESRTPTRWTLADRREHARTAARGALASAAPPAEPSITPQSVGGAAIAPGAIAATGQPCPASGWWRCEDRDALDASRWFAGGSILPHASFLARQRRFGLALGQLAAVPVSRRRSRWKLVRLAPQAGPAQDPAQADGEDAAGRAVDLSPG